MNEGLGHPTLNEDSHELDPTRLASRQASPEAAEPEDLTRLASPHSDDKTRLAHPCDDDRTPLAGPRDDDQTLLAQSRGGDQTRLAAPRDDRTQLVDRNKTRLVQRGASEPRFSPSADEETRSAPQQPAPPPPPPPVGDETVRWEDPGLGSTTITTGGSAYDPGIDGIAETIYGVEDDSASTRRLNPNLGIYAPAPLDPGEVAAIAAQEKKYAAGTRRLQAVFAAGMAAVGVGAVVGIWGLLGSL